VDDRYAEPMAALERAALGRVAGDVPEPLRPYLE